MRTYPLTGYLKPRQTRNGCSDAARTMAHATFAIVGSCQRAPACWATCEQRTPTTALPVRRADRSLARPRVRRQIREPQGVAAALLENGMGPSRSFPAELTAWVALTRVRTVVGEPL